ncbi:helix-turn-helix domain-containing protein [Olivibacter sp. LS-1]|uniref:S24 family peptidase n=1 Tax=Olivibacter sp. LS-1 TaxID=2592345 RepID=UPI0011EA7497|nr:S24 family peptidase [Olivibacter sp. LS-1]QEL01089.1 helix-turn-helix domain-containing protein [Olivibacter sp. LS-1]
MIINGKKLRVAIKSLDLTQEEAAKRLGVTRQTVVNWISRAELDSNILQIVKSNLGIDLSDGTVDIVSPSEDIVTVRRNIRKKQALIPFYNADFMAGNAEAFYEDGTIYPEYYIDVPEFYGCTAFRAYSDSMEKKIKSGSILFGIKLDDWYSHLEYGQIYGITCNDGRRYLKYIRKSEQEDRFFLLKSENPNYDDFKLPKEKIKNIWLIEGWLDKRT